MEIKFSYEKKYIVCANIERFFGKSLTDSSSIELKKQSCEANILL